MATAKVFKRRMNTLGKRVEVNSSKAVQTVVIKALQTVTLATPVDTGRARGNWQVGLGSPKTATLEVTDKSGAGAIGAGTIAVKGRRPKQTVYISNNVDYIKYLNQGSSAQAPANFVERAVRVAAASVKGAKVLK